MWWKTVFTTVTISSGFKGGEVTPLFYVGATLGNALARLLSAPFGLFAGLGFVGVFAGATNTPIACTMRGIELFAAGGSPDLMRSGLVVYLATACFVAYIMSGYSGIYLSQKIGSPKLFSSMLPPETTLRRARELKPGLGGTMLARLASNTTSDNRADRSNGQREEADTTQATDAQTTAPAVASFDGDTNMTHQKETSYRETGRVRIYMDLGERRKKPGLRGVFARPLYQEIIAAARAQGIPNAVAQYVHQGYSLGGPPELGGRATSHKELNLCIELIAEREKLESFCRDHEELLMEKVIVYEHIEHWDPARGQYGAIEDSPLS